MDLDSFLESWRRFSKYESIVGAHDILQNVFNNFDLLNYYKILRRSSLFLYNVSVQISVLHNVLQDWRQ